jgi:hypothetical protein
VRFQAWQAVPVRRSMPSRTRRTRAGREQQQEQGAGGVSEHGESPPGRAQWRG